MWWSHDIMNRCRSPSVFSNLLFSSWEDRFLCAGPQLPTGGLESAVGQDKRPNISTMESCNLHPTIQSPHYIQKSCIFYLGYHVGQSASSSWKSMPKVANWSKWGMVKGQTSAQWIPKSLVAFTPIKMRKATLTGTTYSWFGCVGDTTVWLADRQTRLPRHRATCTWSQEYTLQCREDFRTPLPPKAA